jgi:dimethylargininase
MSAGRIALTRPVPDSLAECELSHLSRTAIDVTAARAQHAAYERVLGSLGCSISRLEAADTLPDSVFVEDTAVVLDEVAVVTRPGAASRRPETVAMATALAAYRPVTFIVEPGTLDGGDVLPIGRILYVGVGSRTNTAGVDQLQEATGLYGYEVRAVAVSACLHLKSAVTALLPGLVLANPAWVDVTRLEGQRAIEVDPAEPSGANVLAIGESIVCAAAFTRTNARLAAAKLAVCPVDVSELAKAEGGVTCCSVIVDA